MSTDSSIPVRALYDVPEAMALLNLSRTQLYDVLRQHRHHQLGQRIRIGERFVENDLVFATRYGTELDAANVRRAFRSVAAAAGLQASE